MTVADDPPGNLNFVSHDSVEHEYKKLDNGLWAPDRTNTYCKFYLLNRKKTLLARQTKLYTDFDFEDEIDKIPDWFLNRQKDYKDGKYSQVVSNALDMKLRDDLERLKKIR